MAVERNKLQELLKQLPEELQSEVLEFVESLLRKGSAGDPGGNGTSSVRRSLAHGTVATLVQPTTIGSTLTSLANISLVSVRFTKIRNRER